VEEDGKRKVGLKFKVLQLLMIVEECVLELTAALLSIPQVPKKEQMTSLNVSCLAIKV